MYVGLDLESGKLKTERIFPFMKVFDVCLCSSAGDLLASYEWELPCSKKADQRRLRQVY